MVATAFNEDNEDRIINMAGPTDNLNRKNRCEEPPNGEEEEDDVIEQLEQLQKSTEQASSSLEDRNADERQERVDNEGSCTRSSYNDYPDVTCSESMPSSDSNKENIDSNVLSQNNSELDPLDYPDDPNFGEIGSTNIPLPQLLKIHVKQLVSGFEFGEATKRQAQENMKTARDKKKSELRKSEEGLVMHEGKEQEEYDANKPCCSKAASEAEHKTPHSRKRQRLTESKLTINPDKDFPIATRRVPDCLVNYPDCKEVWTYMIFKEEAALKLRNPRLFNDFNSVSPRMRAILLDWLMEVASVYHLRRVTYYLSVDYFDRFLSIRPDIPKSLLQLVGITCLYIAAKVEEIYPPNLSEFSYVCDGACKSKEMVSCELLILNSLGWEVVLTTPSDWLNLYMQLHFKGKDIARTSLNLDFNKDFIFPQYSAYQFTRASQLMDLLSLDPGFLKYGYSVIAAAAMYYMYGQEIALSVSGLSWGQLESCVDYMEVFYTIIKDSPDPRLQSCLGGPHPEDINRGSMGLSKKGQNGPQNENYSFQTHVASMDYFEKATMYRLTKYTRQKEQIENPEEIPSVKPDTPDSARDVSATSDNEQEGIVGACPTETEDNNRLLDLTPLEELNKKEAEAELNGENLMSLDEIFELILKQDEPPGTNLD